MIFTKEYIETVLTSNDPFLGSISITSYNEDILDESNGSASFKSENNKTGRPDINIRYSPTDAHKNKIRIKVSDTGNFVDKKKFSEVVFLYDTKEYFYQGQRRMTDTEEKYVFGFIGRYEDALNSNTRKGGIPTIDLTSLIDNDMNNNFLVKKGMYKPCTGKIDLKKDGSEYDFEVSNNKPSVYTEK